MTKNAVAKKASTALAEIDLFDPKDVEEFSSKDIIIPRLNILQALSPQVNKKKPEYIEGAEQGDFCDVATSEIFKGELIIIPCFYAMVYLEWAPRDSGRGLVANHGMDASILAKCKKNEKNQNILSNGNYVVETATYYVLNMSAGGRPSFIPLSSTQLKAARKWNTLIASQKINNPATGEDVPAPIFFRAWKAVSVESSNQQGDWYGWKFAPGDTILEIDPTGDLLHNAKELRRMAQEGLVKGDVQEAHDTVDDDDDKAF